MLGVIHNSFYAFIRQNWGDATCERIKEMSQIPVERNHRINTYYDDNQWQTLLKIASDELEMDADTLEWTFAYFSGEYLCRLFPGFLVGINSARDMLLRQPRIHSTIGLSVDEPARRKQINDKFTIIDNEDGSLTMQYFSPNKMCTFYRGLATWVGTQFDEKVVIAEHKCLKHGHELCEIHLTFEPVTEEDVTLEEMA